MRLEDLYEHWDNNHVPTTDRTTTNPNTLTPTQQAWRTNGWIVAPRLIPDNLIDNYAGEWLTHHAVQLEWAEGQQRHIERTSRGGWNYATPHRDHPHLRNLVCTPHIGNILHELLDEPAGVHLTLTGWVTTTRDWHQDNYLNPPHVGGYYAAVWIALDDIHPDSGPFQYVSGSHLWPALSQAKVRQALGPDGQGPDWPTHSERILTPLFEDKIATDDLQVSTYLPRRGDVLIWHSRLLHRGSKANRPGMERRALIAHYSGVNHRQDMPPAYQTAGGWMFPVDDGNRWA